MNSRNIVITYVMNLELIKISKDIDKNFEFESIWPFILYLFNSWVRHQVQLVSFIEAKPEMREKMPKAEVSMYEVAEY